MSDLVERLRQADQNSQQRIAGSRIFRDAADEIERLTAALKDLLDAYNSDVNPNDRNETAIEHARQAYPRRSLKVALSGRRGEDQCQPL